MGKHACSVLICPADSVTAQVVLLPLLADAEIKKVKGDLHILLEPEDGKDIVWGDCRLLRSGPLVEAQKPKLPLAEAPSPLLRPLTDKARALVDEIHAGRVNDVSLVARRFALERKEAAKILAAFPHKQIVIPKRQESPGRLWEKSVPLIERESAVTYISEVRGLGPLIRWDPDDPNSWEENHIRATVDGHLIWRFTNRSGFTIAVETLELHDNGEPVMVEDVEEDGSPKFDDLGYPKKKKKRTFTGGTLGAQVRIGPEGQVTEGLEDALAVARITGRPCWAAGSSSGYPSYEPSCPVTVYADPDPVGIESANNFRRMRQRVTVLTAEHDPADMWVKHGEQAKFFPVHPGWNVLTSKGWRNGIDRNYHDAIEALARKAPGSWEKGLVDMKQTSVVVLRKALQTLYMERLLQWSGKTSLQVRGDAERDAERLSYALDRKVFNQGGRVVAISQPGDPRDAKLRADLRKRAGNVTDKTLIVYEANADDISYIARNHAFVWRQDKEDGPKTTTFPVSSSHKLIRVTDLRNSLAGLRGVSFVPLIRLHKGGGEIIAGKGYDPETQYVYDAPKVEVPERPTRKEALAAVAVMRERFKGFTFLNGEVGMAGVLAAALSLVARASLDLVPGILVVAPTHTGKTYLLNTLGMQTIGQEPLKFAPGDDKELSHRLTHILSDSNPFIVIDNIGNDLHSDDLAAYQTSGSTRIRRYGTTGEISEAINNNVLGFTTTKAAFSNELMSRNLRIDLTLDGMAADKRTFEPAEPHLMDREEFLRAALTVLRWGVHLRVFEEVKQKSRFRAWDRYIRRPLFQLMGVDPYSSIEFSEEPMESIGSVEENFLEAVAEFVGKKSFRARDLLVEAAFDRLNNLWPHGIEMTTIAIGRFLADHNDHKMKDGRVLRSRGDRKGVNKYTFFHVGTPGQTPG